MSKGPIGLTTLHVPADETVLDLVFIHGLNGGSRSTWTFGGDPALFWPQEWLPKDEAFQDVRIHTFGYDSGFGRESTLNVYDFSRALLYAMRDSPNMHSQLNIPLILFCHSMGGLVAKNAVILGRDNPELEPLVKRICAIFFVATPHQGVNLAGNVRRLLAVALGSRSAVHNLSRDSILLEAINEKFPQYCGHLQLFSFFENKPMNFPWGRSLIIEKQSALMNFANETKVCLDADHRNVVRFSSTEDMAYITVRSYLATCIAENRPAKAVEPASLAYTPVEMSEALRTFLGISHDPEDELRARNSMRTPGSCEWILSSSLFQRWRDAECCMTYWLYGRPGAGKSILAAHIVNHTRELGQDRCFFSFTDRENPSSCVNTFLRSIAWQIALIHNDVFSAITALSRNWRELPLSNIDNSLVWQRLYWRGMLKVRLNRPQYWIIDALDECREASELTALLAKVQEVWPVRILVLSRNPPSTYMSTTNLKTEMVSDPIPEEATLKDISLYLKANIDSLPARLVEPELLIHDIVQRSNGCFLWVNLVLGELRQVYTFSEMKQVLSLTPEKMDNMYKKILVDMSNAKFGKDVAKAVLTWTMCSFRPLSKEELQRAVEPQVNDTIVDIERFINSNCGSLVYVNSRREVQFIHSTAQDFLMRQDIAPQFIIGRAFAHRQIAHACLQDLSSKDTRPPRFRKRSVRRNDGTTKSPLIDYASRFLFDHLMLAGSDDSSIFIALYKFLSSPGLLSWIEYLAAHTDLHRVFQAGKAIKNLLNWQSQHTPPLPIHKEIALIEPWGNDLIRLVMQFGKNLSLSPSSIHHLIPPFCPRSSPLKQQFASSAGRLTVHGFSTSNWNDCVSIVSCPKPTRLVAVATSDEYFAIGSSTGSIALYDNTTCMEWQVLDNRETVECLAFGGTGKYLASTGSRMLRVWDLMSFTEILTIPIPSTCVEVAFAEEDSVLIGAIDSNNFMSWDISNGDMLCDDDWTLDFEWLPSLQSKQPTHVAFSVREGLLAVAYRGEDIVLWNFESSKCHATYQKGVGSRPQGSPKSSTANSTVRSLAFSPAVDTVLLAAAYYDGSVTIYDTYSNTARATLDRINARCLSWSPDGRTLATGDPRGTIKLFDLESLKPIYSIRSDGGLVVSVSFTSDWHRLIDIRQHQCRVLEPATQGETSDALSASRGTQQVDYQAPASVAITAVATTRSAPLIFCGKEDGSVHVYDTTSGLQSQELSMMTSKTQIFKLHFDSCKGLLACSDRGGHIVCRELFRDTKSQWKTGDPLLSVSRERSPFVVLTSAKHSRLLMATRVDDTLWQLPSDRETSYLTRLETKDQKYWMQHESNPDQLIMLTISEVRIYHWANLECLGSVTLSGSLVSPSTGVETTVIPLYYSDLFATSSEDTNPRRTTRTALQIWDLRNITADLEKATCVYNFDAVASSNIERVIGVVGNRLVFLNTSYWVCSVDLEDRNGEEGTVQHFFLPHDWISAMNRSKLDIGRNGDIIFTRRGEMAVIRWGLEFTEKGSFTPARKRGSSPGRGTMATYLVSTGTCEPRWVNENIG